MNAPIRTIGLLGVLMALTGCRSFSQSCADLGSYGTGETRPPLKVPDGLETPDTRNALRIPELAGPPPPPRDKSESCLEKPPAFRPGAVLESKPAKKPD